MREFNNIKIAVAGTGYVGVDEYCHFTGTASRSGGSRCTA